MSAEGRDHARNLKLGDAIALVKKEARCTSELLVRRLEITREEARSLIQEMSERGIVRAAGSDYDRAKVVLDQPVHELDESNAGLSDAARSPVATADSIETECRPEAGSQKAAAISDMQLPRSIDLIGKFLRREVVSIAQLVTNRFVPVRDGDTERYRSEVAARANLLRDERDGVEDGGEAAAPAAYIVAFEIDGELILVAGDIWLKAAIAAERAEVFVEIRQGLRRDAQLYGIVSNSHHGLRLTTEEKRQTVSRLLEDPEWSKWSNREIGRIAGVSRETVRTRRPNWQNLAVEPCPTPLTATSAQSVLYCRNGKLQQMSPAKKARGRDVTHSRATAAKHVNVLDPAPRSEAPAAAGASQPSERATDFCPDDHREEPEVITAAINAGIEFVERLTALVNYAVETPIADEVALERISKFIDEAASLVAGSRKVRRRRGGSVVE